MTNPVDAAFPTTGPANRGAVSAFFKARMIAVLASIAELRGDDYSGHWYVAIRSSGMLYAFDAAETAADDGINVLVDTGGNRFVLAGRLDGAPVAGLSLSDLTLVANLTARAAFDEEAEGFGVLVLDCTGESEGAGRSALYVMGAGGSADWIGPAWITGPPGPPGDVTGTGISAIVALSQAEYDALATPRPATTLYIITD